jgi:hypothetical protein
VKQGGCISRDTLIVKQGKQSVTAINVMDTIDPFACLYKMSIELCISIRTFLTRMNGLYSGIEMIRLYGEDIGLKPNPKRSLPLQSYE